MGRPRGSRNKPRTRRWYVATDSGVTDIDGVPFRYQRNVTRVREGDPVLEMAPHSFKLMDDDGPPEIEQATAAPGEKRGE